MRRWKNVCLGILLFFLFFILVVPAFAGNPPDAAQSSLSATTSGSDSVPADGNTTASMTLTLKDSGAIPLAGDTVNLSIPSDPTAVINPTSTTLDGSGQAIFTITSTTVGTDNIDAVDVTTGTTLTALGQVIFTPIPTSSPSNNSAGSSNGSSSCTQQSPTGAPDLFQVNTTKTTATLFFTQPAGGNFNGYRIFYGSDTNANSYSVHFSQGSSTGANTYTINSLTPNTLYYFKIRAENDCASGPFSLIRQSNYPASSLTQLPATGPNDLWLHIGIVGIIATIGGFVMVLAL